MGRFSFGSTASTAGLNRSRCPGCTESRPAARAPPARSDRRPRPDSPPAASPPADPVPHPAAPRPLHDASPSARPRRPHPASDPPSAARRSLAKTWNPVLLRGLGRARRIRLHGRNQRHALARRLQLAHHAQMVAPKRSGAGHGHAQMSFRWLFRGLFLRPFSFHGLQAAAVELEQLVHVLLRLGRGRAA